jgi:hypothetical protein
MIVTHIFADSRGESHFADVEIPLTLIPVAVNLPPMRTSPAIASTHVQFVTVPPAVIAHDWHPAPASAWWSRRRQNHTQVSRSDCSIGSTGRSSASSTTFLTRSRSTGSRSQTVWLP